MRDATENATPFFQIYSIPAKCERLSILAHGHLEWRDLCDFGAAFAVLKQRTNTSDFGDTIRMNDAQSRPCCQFDADTAVGEVLDFLRQVSHSLLAGFPDVQRWDQTDDILQQAALRLHRALQETTPESRRHLENLAALQVRRTLIDLGRAYSTRAGMNYRRWTPPHPGRDTGGLPEVQASAENDPQKIIEWVELHEQIEQLPAQEQEVFQLIWYRGLSKEEVATILDVDLRTIQRRWRAARETLASRCGGMPNL